jgi:hypothetical protein
MFHRSTLVPNKKEGEISVQYWMTLKRNTAQPAELRSRSRRVITATLGESGHNIALLSNGFV